MPTLEKENYLIHYNIYNKKDLDITSVELFAEVEINAKKTKAWVWADSLPDNARDVVYDEALRILQREL